MAATGQRGQEFAGGSGLPLHNPGDVGSDLLINLARGLLVG